MRSSHRACRCRGRSTRAVVVMASMGQAAGVTRTSECHTRQASTTRRPRSAPGHQAGTVGDHAGPAHALGSTSKPTLAGQQPHVRHTADLSRRISRSGANSPNLPRAPSRSQLPRYAPATGWLKGLPVTDGGTGVVSHAGVALIRALADDVGLTGGLSKALAPAGVVRAGRLDAHGVAHPWQRSPAVGNGGWAGSPLR